MTDQKFIYTTFDGEQHSLQLSWLHLAKTELELNVSVTEWSGRIEPQLAAGYRAWRDTSADNRKHFLSWCEEIDSVDGHKTFVTVDGGEPAGVPYKVFIDAERFFDRSFLHLTVNNTLNLRMFIVWSVAERGEGDFYKWLAKLPSEFVCDVYSEDGDARPKV